MSDIQIKQTKMWEKDINKLIEKGKTDKLESYKKIIAGTSCIDNSIKEEYIKLCDDAIEEINSISQEDDIENDVEFDVIDEEASSQELDGEEIDASDVTVGENTKHIKVKRTALALLAAVVVLASGTTLSKCSKGKQADDKQPDKTTTESSSAVESETEEVEENVKTIKDTLKFDTEDTEVMITNAYDFINDSMPKGLKLSDKHLTNDIESFADFYIALNIDEIGPGYLAKLYQSDNKSYLDVFNNFVHWSMTITDEAMMSSAKEGTTFDITSLVANKEEARLLQKAFNLLAVQHDNGLSGDIAALESTTAKFRSLLEKTLLKETSSSYSTPFKVMLAYSAMNFDTLLMNYENILLVDNDVRKILYEDAEISCSMALRDTLNRGETLSDDDLLLLLNASEKNQSAVEFALQLEKKFDQVVILYNTAGLDYSKEISIEEVIKRLVEKINLSLYKKNQEYTEYNDITYEINHPTIKVPENAVIINDDNNNYFIEKEELDKYNIDTTNKTTEEIKKEYESKVEEKVEEEIKNDKKFTDNDNNVLKTGEDSVDYASEYSKGYTAGSKQGAKDGNALASKNTTTTGSEGYIAGYAKGYEESYKKAKAARLAAEKETSTKIEKIDPIVTDTKIIEKGTKKVNDKSTTTSTETEKKNNTNNQTETVIIVEPETTTVVEEVVIEEGTIPYSYEEEFTISYNSAEKRNSEEETTTNYKTDMTGMSYEELYNMYYQYLYGSDSNSIGQTTEKTK